MIEKNPFYQGFTGLETGTDPSPTGLAVVLAVGIALILLPVLWKTRHRPARRSFDRSRRNYRNNGKQAPKRFDRRKMYLPEHQMQVIAEATFETCPLLNSSEAKLLPVLESAVVKFGRGHRVMAQTSVGELLRPRSEKGRKDLTEAAYAAINSKRFDFAIIDHTGRLVAAVEYQGAGHYGRSAFIRDAVKREVCRKAGVAFVEVKKGMLPSELTEMLRDLLAPSAPAATAAE